jgi:hypothetical protein
MKLPLIAACVVAGSTWSFASTNVASNTNPKTAQKSYHASGKSVFGSQVSTKTAGSVAPIMGEEPTADELAQINARASRKAAQQAAAGGSTSTTTGSGAPHSMVTTQAPTEDDCSTPMVLVAATGLQTYPFDTTNATTGVDGQTAGTFGCQVGLYGNLQDCWFQWTAPVTNTLNIRTCAMTGVDTKLTFYNGAGCPTAAFIGCNDNGCAPQSQILAIAVTAGQTYTLQLGSSPQTGGHPGGPGSFSLEIFAPPPPPVNDDCSAATAIVGPGSFAYDNTGATTAIGAPNNLCTTYAKDVWFNWTATFTGTCLAQTCATTPLIDTVLAIYNGGGCPGGAPVACNDDDPNCGGVGGLSITTFPCVAGLHYEVQVACWSAAVGGAVPGGTTATGILDMINITLPPPNDNCTSPTVLVGTGTFPYDNLSATTGTQGQTEALCLSFSQTGIDRDVWYQWTAPSGGCTKISNCGGLHDSKMAVYPGSGCPIAGSAIACNDDFCAPQSGVFFQATAGATYLIQLGSFPGQLGATGTLAIAQVPAGAGNDECSSPIALVGTGVFPYDNSFGTTGCDGQTETLCGQQGNGTTMENDVWYTWVAPASGYAIWDTCGFTADDTRMGVYAGGSCPTAGSAIACRDDSCAGFQTTLIWPVLSGSTYMLQLGNFPGTAGGVGAFNLDMTNAPGPCDPWDDGTFNIGWGYFGPNDMVYMNRFGTPGNPITLDSIDMTFGSFTPTNVPDGTPTEVFVWTDGPSQDGDPSDATLVLTINTTIQNGGTGIFTNIPVIPPLNITGRFFVGTHILDPIGVIQTPGSGYNLGLDTTVHNWLETTWLTVAFGAGTPADYANLALNPVPVQSVETWNLQFGQALVRVNCSFGPATYTCTPGDPGINLCPCSNPPTGSGRGCNNKAVTGGASIVGAGSNSVGTPTLTFTTAGENPTVGSVLIQGTAFNPGINFGHGVRCTAGVIKRLYVKIAAGGSITAPAGGDPSIPVKSASLGSVINPGDTRYYSVYYRDTTVLLPGCPVPANQFNVSNTAIVVWQP